MFLYCLVGAHSISQDEMRFLFLQLLLRDVIRRAKPSPTPNIFSTRPKTISREKCPIFSFRVGTPSPVNKFVSRTRLLLLSGILSTTEPSSVMASRHGMTMSINFRNVDLNTISYRPRRWLSLIKPVISDSGSWW